MFAIWNFLCKKAFPKHSFTPKKLKANYFSDFDFAFAFNLLTNDGNSSNASLAMYFKSTAFSFIKSSMYFMSSTTSSLILFRDNSYASCERLL